MLEEINKEKIRSLLNGDLPGERAQVKMRPADRLAYIDKDKCREAAVLILLYPDADSIHVVFIKRNEYNGPHSGQISFPGGMKELSDKDFMQTALRETEEEIGIAGSDIDILGNLSTFFIPVSNFCVYPYVGWYNKKPVFKPDKTEVQYLICPSLEALVHPENRKTGQFLRQGKPVTTPYIAIDKEMIWGATAMMLSEFIDLLGY